MITALVGRLQTLSVPRSLVELRIDEAEYEGLLRWGAGLSSRRVHEDLFWGLSRYNVGGESWTANEFVGIGLFMLITEIARRNATEGGLWPSIVEHFPVCRGELFASNDQPTQLLKDGLEAAARKAQLRHVFGKTGTQEWYLSVYLQFGFTESGITRIADWLAGYPKTTSINILLGEDQQFSDNASGAFRELWGLLQEVRNGTRKPEHVRHLLTFCPFILPVWATPLLAEAQRHVDSVGHQEQHGADTLFEAPCLRWPPGDRPRLVTRPRKLAWANLDPVPHRIIVDGRPCGYVGYGADGQGTSIQELVLPDRTGSCIIELEADGRSVYQQEVELWSADDDITVFRSNTGRRIAAYCDLMSTNDPYYVGTAPDVRLSPEPTWFYRGENMPVHLYELRPPWPRDIGATLEGYNLWRPRLTPEPRAEPRWAQDIRIVPSGPGRAKVEAQPPTVICRVKIGGTVFPAGAIQYTALPPKQVYTATISAECRGEKAIILRRVEAEPVGLERRGDRWQRISTRNHMSTAEAEQLIIKVSRNPDEELCLMAGHVLVKRLTGFATHIGRVSGFGEPLGVFSGRFNGAQPRDVIAKALEDTGVIIGIDHNFGAVRLKLQYHVNLTPQHSVMILGADGGFTRVPPDRINVIDRQWLLQRLSAEQENGWIAVAFKGERLGAIWPAAPLRARPLTGPLSPERKAAFLRWFRIPICASDLLSHVRHLAQSKPAACLRAWLAAKDFETAEGETLRFGNDAGEEWWAAVREACWTWRCEDRGVSDEILSAVSGPDSPFTVGCGVLRAADPLLACRVLNPILMEEPDWFEHLNVTLPGDAYLMMLREEVSREDLRADPYFLDDLVTKARAFSRDGIIQRGDEDNLKLALHSDRFRQYLFLRLCKDRHAPP